VSMQPHYPAGGGPSRSGRLAGAPQRATPPTDRPVVPREIPDVVSATLPDWQREISSRNEWSPSRRLLAALRAYQQSRPIPGAVAAAARKVAVARHRFWTAICGCDIPLNCQIAGGLCLPHPNGIVIHPDARIGPNCLIFQQVTIGTGGPIPGAPVIGGHVDIGAGAKVLGGVFIGDHSRIGANAVVMIDVPPGATAVGIPARIVPSGG
jgi:serine O-acetyltransferase